MKCGPHAHTMGTTFRVPLWRFPERHIGLMTTDMLQKCCPGTYDIRVTLERDGLLHKQVHVRVSSNSAMFCSDFITQFHERLIR